MLREHDVIHPEQSLAECLKSTVLCDDLKKIPRTIPPLQKQSNKQPQPASALGLQLLKTGRRLVFP